MLEQSELLARLSVEDDVYLALQFQKSVRNTACVKKHRQLFSSSGQRVGRKYLPWDQACTAQTADVIVGAHKSA